MMKNKSLFSKVKNTIVLYLEHALSRVIGVLCFCRKPVWIKKKLIRLFVKRYKIDMTQFAKQTPEEYEHFNEFFLRQPKDLNLSQGAPNDIKSPAAGVVTYFGVLGKGDQQVKVKGDYYTFESLLMNHQIDIEAFRNSQCLVIYLSPDSYHRVHMPVTGELEYTVSIPGYLHSVFNGDAELLSHNARVASIFKTDYSKKIAIIQVGAFFVASIHTVWSKERMTPFSYVKTPKIQYANAELPEGKKIILNSGEEMGSFCLGSTVILLFSPETPIQWHPDLVGKQVECGEIIGSYLLERSSSTQTRR